MATIEHFYSAHSACAYLGPRCPNRTAPHGYWGCRRRLLASVTGCVSANTLQLNGQGMATRSCRIPSG